MGRAFVPLEHVRCPPPAGFPTNFHNKLGDPQYYARDFKKGSKMVVIREYHMDSI